MAELRELGRTGIRISALGLGCWQFSGPGMMGKYWGVVPQQEVDVIVRAALDGGITWFDTAQAYGNGSSEQRLAAALVNAGKKDGEVTVATKWWPLLRTAGNAIRTSKDRLRYLSPFHIDLHQVHQPFALASVEAQMDAMAKLVKDGKIRSVGVSNFNAERTRRAHAALAKHGLPLASNQMQYSLLDRSIEKNGVMEACKELGVTLIAYSPLAQGVLSGRYHDGSEARAQLKGPRRYLRGFSRRGLEKAAPVVKELKAIAAAHGAAPTQVALAWLLQIHGNTVVAIPGASKPKQVTDLVATLGLRLSEAEVASLDEKSRGYL